MRHDFPMRRDLRPEAKKVLVRPPASTAASDAEALWPRARGSACSSSSRDEENNKGRCNLIFSGLGPQPLLTRPELGFRFRLSLDSIARIARCRVRKPVSPCARPSWIDG
jgi:hypothetical protein